MFFIYQILYILTCTLKRHLPSCDTSWVHCWVCSDTGHLRPSCTSGWKNYESQSDQFYPGPSSNLSVGLFGQWSPVKNGEPTVGGERHGHLLVEGGEVGVGLLVAQLGHPDHALLVAVEEVIWLRRRRKSIACMRRTLCQVHIWGLDATRKLFKDQFLVRNIGARSKWRDQLGGQKDFRIHN